MPLATAPKPADIAHAEEVNARIVAEILRLRAETPGLTYEAALPIACRNLQEKMSREWLKGTKHER